MRDETAAVSIDRNDVAQYVDSLFLVYIILVIASVAISWYQNVPRLDSATTGRSGP